MKGEEDKDIANFTTDFCYVGRLSFSSSFLLFFFLRVFREQSFSSCSRGVVTMMFLTFSLVLVDEGHCPVTGSVLNLENTILINAISFPHIAHVSETSLKCEHRISQAKLVRINKK